MHEDAGFRLSSFGHHCFLGLGKGNGGVSHLPFSGTLCPYLSDNGVGLDSTQVKHEAHGAGDVLGGGNAHSCRERL